ncbi:hypothetical protein D9M68_997620 [compost metagenome]
MVADCQRQVQAAVDNFEAAGTQPVESVLDHVYARWPAALGDQREMLMERVSRREEPSPGAARHPLPHAVEGNRMCSSSRGGHHE